MKMQEKKVAYIMSKFIICIYICEKFVIKICYLLFNNIIYFFFSNCRVVNPSMKACDPELASQLWKYSCELLGLSSDIELKELLKIISNKEII